MEVRMNSTIMAVKLETRSNFAPELQEILTKHGCIIKLRLGLHETSDEFCSQSGLILLELSGKDDEILDLKNDLLTIKGLKINSMVI
jgi:hypothetical protein